MKNLLLLFLLLFCFSQCKESSLENTGQVTEKDMEITKDVIGLISPVQLENKKQVIHLEDYFMDVSKIDSFFVPGFLKQNLSVDKKKLTLTPVSKSMPKLALMQAFIGDRNYDFLLKGPQKKKVQLSLKDRGFRNVKVKGEMNAWNPNKAVFKKSGALWTYEFELNPGDYQYMFMVDGKEMLDPDAPQTSNGSGGYNSVLSLPKAKEELLPGLYTKEKSGRKIILGFENKPTAVFAFWNNTRIDANIANNQIELSIPPGATAVKRSTLRVWAYNNEGLANDIFVPLENGRPVTKSRQLNRSDFHAQIMYFTLVDRFNNGDKKNDDPVKDDRLLPKTNYMGGDLAGITAKIKDGYFKKLNINSIWLSPVTQNPLKAYQEFPEPHRFYSGYHGYWPIFSYKVDHRFGDDKAMHDLVNAAHDNGINVLLDYICNHVHEEHQIFKQHPDWATRLDLPNGKKNIRIWDEQRLTTWFDTFLPSLDLSRKEVIDLQTDSAMYWIKKFNLDGYRHDATKHVPLPFWRTLTRKLKEEVMLPENKKLYQVGETYGSRELVQSYIGSGLLDAQFDFNLYFDSREVFALPDASFKKVANAMRETFNYYGHHSTMAYISGNHDIPRFISLAGGDLKFNENDREAGFEREIGVGDPVGYDRLSMLTAFIMTIPGIPVLYYGDEIGMPGAGDPDNRRMMKFSGLTAKEAATKATAEKLTKLRKNSLALIYGDTKILHEGDMTFAFLRHYFDEVALVVFNKSAEEKTIELELPKAFSKENLDTNFKGKLRQNDEKVSIVLPPNSFEVLFN